MGLERLRDSLPGKATGRKSQDHKTVDDAISGLQDARRPDDVRYAAAVTPAVDDVLRRHPIRDLVTTEGPYALYVDRQRALYGSWYEFFPRSEGARIDPATGKAVSGTFRTAAERLDAVAAMGFDVIYLPPIHPIGEVNRKGRNNSTEAAPDDVGSPWGIRDHCAVHPDLGTLKDFRRFRKEAAQFREEGSKCSRRCFRRGAGSSTGSHRHN